MGSYCGRHTGGLGCQQGMRAILLDGVGGADRRYAGRGLLPFVQLLIILRLKYSLYGCIVAVDLWTALAKSRQLQEVTKQVKFGMS